MLEGACTEHGAGVDGGAGQPRAPALLHGDAGDPRRLQELGACAFLLHQGKIVKGKCHSRVYRLKSAVIYYGRIWYSRISTYF